MAAVLEGAHPPRTRRSPGAESPGLVQVGARQNLDNHNRTAGVNLADVYAWCRRTRRPSAERAVVEQWMAQATAGRAA